MLIAMIEKNDNVLDNLYIKEPTNFQVLFYESLLECGLIKNFVISDIDFDKLLDN